MSVRVGLLDSGVDPPLRDRLIAAKSFIPNRDGVISQPLVADPTGHGTVMAEMLLAVPGVELLGAQVFTRTGPTSPAVIAAGLGWLLGQGVQLVNMSFGLRQDRAVLRDACARAINAEVILLAASPARGAPVWPAAYPGVLRISGDARCAADELSDLASAQADFGACPQGGDPRTGGASLATVRVMARVAEYLAAGGESGDIVAHLRELACYHGPEIRR